MRSFQSMKGVADFVVALGLAVVLAVPMVIVATLIRVTSKGPAVYWSDRIGRHNIIFKMPKFRTMKLGTPAVASHLLDDSVKYLTPIGGFLRRSSIDELPQLWNILRGEMSFVGPRPALFNQNDLMAMRKLHGIDQLVPGVTGWAQVNGRDELSITEKVHFDHQYLHRQSFIWDVKILWLTLLKVSKSSGVSH